MQNMAAIQFVLKINSKLHIQVGQESVDKGLHAIFKNQTEARTMKETILQYQWQFLLIPRQGYCVEHAH